MLSNQAVITTTSCKYVLEFLVVYALEKDAPYEEVFSETAKRVDVNFAVNAKTFCEGNNLLEMRYCWLSPVVHLASLENRFQLCEGFCRRICTIL
jgi:hypothetical protein